MTINLEKMLNIINKDTNQSKRIKTFKQKIYFLMENLNKFIPATKEELEKMNKKLMKIKKKNLSSEELEKIYSKSIKAPNNETAKKMLIATKGIFTYTIEGLNIGSLSLSYLTALKSFDGKDINKLAKIQHIAINLAKKYLSKLPLDSIGLELQINEDELFKKGMKIPHKKPDWEKNLKFTTIKDLGYDHDELFKRTHEITSLYLKNKKMLDILYLNTKKTQKLAYDVCDLALEGLSKNPNAYVKLFYVTKNLFYLNEIMAWKTNLWLKKTMKYHLKVIEYFYKK